MASRYSREEPSPIAWQTDIIQESADGIITMTEDDPEAFGLLLQYLYTLSTKFLDDTLANCPEIHVERTKVLVSLSKLFILTDKYDVSVLADSIARIFNDDVVAYRSGGDKGPNFSLRGIMKAIEPLNELRGQEPIDKLRKIITSQLAANVAAEKWRQMSKWENVDGNCRGYVEQIDDLLAANPMIARDAIEAFAKQLVGIGR